jgi:hypothetical protein
MKYKAEMRMDKQMLDVVHAAGNKIVKADNIVAFSEKAVAKMGS